MSGAQSQYNPAGYQQGGQGQPAYTNNQPNQYGGNTAPQPTGQQGYAPATQPSSNSNPSNRPSGNPSPNPGMNGSSYPSGNNPNRPYAVDSFLTKGDNYPNSQPGSVQGGGSMSQGGNPNNMAGPNPPNPYIQGNNGYQNQPGYGQGYVGHLE